MIKLEDVTKVYPGASKPAVAELNMEVPEGETCVLIGPSGCGKTTTMKMVNRLIEPTTGKIFVDGKNIMERDPVDLRRDIGYVIQQIGLFPHMTIADNIAVVPELKGWDKQRTSKRIDELLAMVGLEPADFRDRYPRELSGGQRQRVGVARALAADPPVMLMDEPFGAIDPITREHLQNEFLRLQKRINKTIIFVTHDIDEAIKMGTLIAILQVGGVLQQLDSPSNILAQPANEFVADFVGADRGLKRLNLVRVGTVMHSDMAMARADNSAGEALALMDKEKVESILVVDDADRLVGYLAREAAEANRDKKAGDVAREVVTFTQEEATMKDAFSEMLSSGVGYMPVVGDKNKVLGIVKATDAQRLIEDVPQA